MRVFAHGRTENGTEDTACLVVQVRFRGTTVPQAFQVGTGKMIIGITVRCGAPQAIGPGSHLDIQAVGDGLVVVSCDGEDFAFELGQIRSCTIKPKIDFSRKG